VQAAELLDLLSALNVRVEVFAKCFADRCVDADPWYGGRYLKTPPEGSWRILWSRAAGESPAGGAELEQLDAEGEAANRGMWLPGSNAFIPSDLALRDYTLGSSPEFPLELTIPAQGIARVFHRQDDRFRQPKAVIAFRIHSPMLSHDATSYLRGQIWCSCVAEELNEYAYNARSAGLAYGLSALPSGLELSVSGFRDKLPVLLGCVAQKMRDATALSPSTFEIVRDRYERGLRNRVYKQRPVDLAARKVRESLGSLRFRAEDLLEELGSLKLSDFDGESSRLLDECRVEALVIGDLCQQEAFELVAVASKALGVPVVPDALPERSEAELPPGRTVWHIDGTNDEERNNCVRLEIQLPADMNNYVYASLLVRMLSHPLLRGIAHEAAARLPRVDVVGVARGLPLHNLFGADRVPARVREGSD